MIPTTREAATALIIDLGAPPVLLRHNDLVLEAAEMLMAGMKSYGEHGIREEVVRIGVVFHDVGKIWHPNELHGDGNLHEQEGHDRLFRYGVTPELCLFCTSYGRWLDDQLISVEECIVALADKLWKGARDATFEEHVTQVITYDATGEPRRFADWWCALDSLYEKIADDGHRRLERSRHIPFDADLGDP